MTSKSGGSLWSSLLKQADKLHELVENKLNLCIDSISEPGNCDTTSRKVFGRQAIKRKLIIQASHEFELSILKEPTICHLCLIEPSLICIPLANKCRLCNLTLHRDCTKQILDRCIASNDQLTVGQIGEYQERKHDFKITTFLKPTFCWNCGTLIGGVINQGYRCSNECTMTVHKGCKDVICLPCIEPSDRRSRQSNSLEIEKAGRIPDKSASSSHISIDQFELIGRLGEGTFSCVYLARRRTTGKEYAIKVMEKSNVNIQDDPESARLERRCLELGRQSPFLVAGSCCFQSKSRLFFVMEYGHNGDLYGQLSARLDRNLGPFSEADTRFYAAEITLALRFLHKRHIIFRDLKLENIILDSSGHSKLIDFGMSRDLNQTTSSSRITADVATKQNMTTNTFCGTQFYMSPEVIRRKPYGKSVDWWALGIAIYELVTGNLPFGFEDCADDEEQIYERILNQECRLPRRLSPDLRTLVDGLLKKNPEERIGCQILEGSDEAILRHPFFNPRDIPDQICGHTSFWEAIDARTIQPPKLISNRKDPLTCYDQTTNVELLMEEDKKTTLGDFHGFSYYCESFAEDPLISSNQSLID